MTKADLDVLWNRALQESVKAGEQFTRYHFAALVAAAEREECAKLAERLQSPASARLAEGIRARSST